MTDLVTVIDTGDVVVVDHPDLVTLVDGYIPVPGPPGLPGTSTPIVAVAFDDWPPADPVPNTLYLRLAP